MSADKQTRAVNRFHDYRVTKNQLAIWRLYNTDEWLTLQQVPGFRKRKAMNCSCGTCRGWAQEAKRFRYNLQLEKQGMKEKHNKSFWDERPDIIRDEEYDGLISQDSWEDYCSEEDWI